jgi:hypothetical protein
LWNFTIRCAAAHPATTTSNSSRCARELTPKGSYFGDGRAGA